MQDPPPSEVYIAEQPQEYPTYNPLSASDQEIAIYYNQPLVTSYARLCKTLRNICIIIFLLLLIGLIASFAFSADFEASTIMLMTITSSMLFVAIIGLSWWIRVIASLYGPSRKPVLHITPDTITIRNTFLIRNRVIPWNEIQTLHARNSVFGISQATSFSSTAGTYTQPRKGTNKLTFIPLVYLDTPGLEISRQIKEKFAHEISLYNIQFRP